GRGFDHFDPRVLSIKLGVELSLNGLEVSPLSHCICNYYICYISHMHGWCDDWATGWRPTRSGFDSRTEQLFVGRGFDPFDPRHLSIKLDVELSLNGLEVSPLSHCIYSRLN
ncbi:hypothetical protein SFRURICE_008094, partial [Spodoptera frugiperda]